jgi:hypothetical protein
VAGNCRCRPLWVLMGELGGDKGLDLKAATSWVEKTERRTTISHPVALSTARNRGCRCTCPSRAAHPPWWFLRQAPTSTSPAPAWVGCGEDLLQLLLAFHGAQQRLRCSRRPPPAALFCGTWRWRGLEEERKGIGEEPTRAQGLASGG